jgi:hypothetical protein
MGIPPSSGSSNPSATQDQGTGESARTSPTDLPLAMSLPSWDLVPLHTLLVRRKPGNR